MVFNFSEDNYVDKLPSGISIFVGPSNTGKSYVLEDIYSEMLRQSKSCKYINNKIPVRELMFEILHNSNLIIDGIEDGRHYKEYKYIIDTLQKVRENQHLFITTHSKEFLMELYNHNINLTLYKFFLDEVNRDIVAEVISVEAFRLAMENDVEIRG